MKKSDRRPFVVSAILFAALFVLFVVAFSRPAHAAPASDPNAIPPEVLKAAQAAAAAGRPFEIVRLPSSSETANAAGPSSTASGDGLKQSVSGTAPDIGLSIGGHSTGGSTKASQSANAFAPFDPSGSNVSGWIFILLGIVLLVGRVWVPLIPLTAGYASIATGVVLLVLPSFLNQHPFVAVVIVGIVAVGFLLVVGSKAKWFDLQVSPEVQQQLQAKGQVLAAGALAHLEANAPFASARKVRRASQVIAEAKRAKATKTEVSKP